jgi:molecular chaperone GrpE
MFQKIFEKNNIKEIDPLNELFNPEFHQAINTNKDTTKKNDVISEVVQKGYMLNDRVVKPALVIVVKNS